MKVPSTPLSSTFTGEMRLRVLSIKTTGPLRSSSILLDTAFDSRSKIRVCIRTLQSFLHADVSQLMVQICRVSADGRFVNRAKAVPFVEFRQLVVDQWIFTQIRRGLMKCFYQPIVDSRLPGQPQVIGHETLIRCPMPGGLTLHAKELFSLAYNQELLRELHVAALWCCLRGSLKIRGAGKLFVNIDPGLVDTGAKFWNCIANLLNENEITPDDVVFEIVETRQARDIEGVEQFSRNARAAGYRIALDDFGMQANPFQLLMATRPDYIKLESTLIRGCTDDRWRRCVAGNLISLARKLSIQCIVEGIENDIELEWANQQRASLIQGFRFGRPSPDPVLRINNKSPIPQRPRFLGISLAQVSDPLQVPVRP